MRLWSIHPRHLDGRGLVAVWREGLLAKAVLAGKTRGYRNHPQLRRFRAHPQPRAAINTYLVAVSTEARRRGYRFDARKIGRTGTTRRITVTRRQLQFEWAHLLAKLRKRSPGVYRVCRAGRPLAHPLFRVVAGSIEDWEPRGLTRG
jgi:hypothetical protein